MQAARVPTPCSPTAKAVPYGVTDSRREKYSFVDTLLGSLLMFANIILTTYPPDGDNFIVLKMEVLFLMRTTQITRISSKERAFVLVYEGKRLYTFSY